MLSILDILLLILAAHSASAGPLPRYLNTTSIHAFAGSSLPPIASVSSSSMAVQSPNGLSTTNNPASSHPPPPTLTSSNKASSHPLGTGNSNSLSSSSSAATPLAVINNTSLHSAPAASISPSLLGGHRGSATSFPPSSPVPVEVTSTTTFTTTTTILPPSRANISDTTGGSFNRPKFPTGGSGSVPYHSSGFHSRVSSSSLFQPGSSSSHVPAPQSSQAAQSSRPAHSSQLAHSSQIVQSSQPAPTTASFVLGSSTFQVTVSQGRGNVGSSSAPFHSESTTTVHITRMSTILFTTTLTTPLSSLSSSVAHVHHDRPHGGNTGKPRPTSSSPFPTSFPTFTFHPHLSSSSSAAAIVTSLPPVVSSSSAPPRSALPSSASSNIASQEASSSASSSVMAGITIVPVNPDATTVYMTVIETEAGVTTTVAKGTVTVTVQPSQNSHWHHWDWHGNGGG